MAKKCVETTVEAALASSGLGLAVGQLQADMTWVKKLIWLTLGSSLTAALGVVGQILLTAVRHS